MVPITTQKPVTRLVENKVPVQKVEWVQEQHVRPVAVQRESYKLETVTQEVPIKTYTMEKVVQKVQRPYRVAKTVPYVETRMMPKTVTMRVPLSYYDPYSTSIVDNYSSWMPVVNASATTPAPIEAQKPAQAAPNKVEKMEVQKPAVEPNKEAEEMPNPSTFNLGDEKK